MKLIEKRKKKRKKEKERGSDCCCPVQIGKVSQDHDSSALVLEQQTEAERLLIYVIEKRMVRGLVVAVLRLFG